MKKLLKSITAMVLCIAVITLFSSCGKDTPLSEKFVEEITGSTVRVEYDALNWQREYSLPAEVETAISVSVITKTGELAMSISAEGQDPVYTGKITDDCEFTVYVKPGNYKVSLQALKHGGSVLLEWGER